MNEVQFGYRIRQALNEGVERLDYKTTFRLQRARRAALEHCRPGAPEIAWTPALPVATARGPDFEEDRSGAWRWLQRAGLVVPVLALLVGFIVIHEWQHARTLDELAAIDFALLLDEAPVEAYADKGFGVLLTTGDTQ
jgi:hypothetical protein